MSNHLTWVYVEFLYENKNYKFSTIMMGIFNIYNLMASIAAVHITDR